MAKGIYSHEYYIMNIKYHHVNIIQYEILFAINIRINITSNL